MSAAGAGGRARPRVTRPPLAPALLGVALLTAAALRFAHLGWGLRHAPHMDEQYFVRNVARMLATGSFDHGFYEYPGLLFYLLAPVLALAGASDPPAAPAYLAARALVAAFGVLSVALAYAFGARLAGRGAALLAAFALAVSPVHVETAHMLRPDVVLEALTLLALVSLLRLGSSLRDDARAGAAAGLAVGLKFSAGLLAVPYLAQRLLRPGPRLRGSLVAALAAATVFVIVSPYALLRHEAFGEGLGTQLAYHFQPRAGPPEPYASRLMGYARVWPKALGPAGALLALAGLALVVAGRPRPPDDAARPAPRLRDWLPFLLLPPLTAAVFASTGFHFDRHLIPSFGVVALLSGFAVQAVHDRSPTLGTLLAGVALAFPAVASVAYVQAIGRAGTRDRAADWIAAHAPGRARVLSAVPQLVLDAERFEVQPARLGDPLARALVRGADVVATLAKDEPAAVFDGLPPATLIEPSSPYEGPPIALRLVPPEAQLRYAPVRLSGATLGASMQAQALERLRDGRLDTYWDADTRAGRDEWIQIGWPAPVTLARVELLLGGRPHDAGRRLRVLVSDDGRGWRALRVARGRPSVRKQLGEVDQPSEVLLFEPVETRFVRVERRGGRRQAAFPRWSVAELRFESPASE